MRERIPVATRPAVRSVTAAIDVVILTPRKGTLAVLLVRAPDSRAKDRLILPWDSPRADEPPDSAASRIAAAALGTPGAALEQSGVHGNARRHPGDTQISVAFVGLVPNGAEPLGVIGTTWVEVDALPLLAPRHREIIDEAVRGLRRRIDQEPLAFSLLPPVFSLSELQSVYELLLGRRLHKASFRRALQSAFLVEPTDAWRREGRGRPAQLYRYAPRRRRGARRGVRFDLVELAN